MMNIALNYRSKGLSVIPLGTNKRPLVTSWTEYQKRLPTQAEITDWWTRWPDANIGIITGALSGITVIDVDYDKGGLQSLKELGIASPTVATTGRGQHAYFRFHSSVKTGVNLKPGIDIRSEGGYVMAPPSRHENGRLYTWRGLSTPGFNSLPEVPSSLFQKIIKKYEVPKRDKDPDWIIDVLNNLRKGERHQKFAQAIGYFNRRGLTPNMILEILKPYAQQSNFNLHDLEDEVRRMCDRYLDQSPLSHMTDTYDLKSFLELDENISWICPGLIADRSIGFIAGLPESFKSWMMIDLAIETTRDNGCWLGRFPVRKCRTLYIDQERFKGETRRRFAALLKAKGMDSVHHNSPLFLKCGTSIRIDLTNSYDAFRTELDIIQPDLILIDSFSTFHTKEENNRREINEVLEKIKTLRTEFGCSFIFIDHENKGVYQKEQDGKEPSLIDLIGSVGKSQVCECLLTVRKKNHSSSMVYHTKSTLGKTIEPFMILVSDKTSDKSEIIVEAI